MKKFVFILSLIIIVISNNSCKKVLKGFKQDGEISFLIRLPSIAQSRFEAKCVTEDILLFQVKIQSPNNSVQTIDFQNQYFSINEAFIFGNLATEDGTWFITFIGTSALTNLSFSKTQPYEMVIEGDDFE